MDESLSDKEFDSVGESHLFVYKSKDIKEFIQKLKEVAEETHNCDENCKGYEACRIAESWIINKEVLDRLAGEKLVKEDENGLD